MAQSMAFQNATWLVETAKAGYEDGFRMFGHSLIVALMPRFRMTGTSTLPTSFSRSKFCMLRVPI